MIYDNLEETYVRTSFGKIHCRMHIGNGKKIVFLHGIGANVRTWKRFVEQLPEDLDIYLIDLLGHGESDAPEMEYSARTQVKVVEEFLGIKGLSGAYLFGHSYGGWIASLVALGNPDTAGLVLEDSLGLKEYFDDLENADDKDERREKLIKDAMLLDPREQVIRSTVESAEADAEDYLTGESLGRLAMPTLILWGGDDEELEEKYALTFAKYIKGSELEIIEGAGHIPHFARAADVRDLLLRFIGYY